MPPRRATRDQAPPLDDTPTREELIEALANLRIKSEAEWLEWKRLEGLNYIGPSKDAKAKWVATHTHINNMIDGIAMIDLLARTV